MGNHKFYKVLRTNNKGIFASDGLKGYTYPAPVGNKPGKRTRRIAILNMCGRGYHLATGHSLRYWVEVRRLPVLIYEAEVEDKYLKIEECWAMRHSSAEKVLVHQTRLLRLVGYWDPRVNFDNFTLKAAQENLAVWRKIKRKQRGKKYVD